MSIVETVARTIFEEMTRCVSWSGVEGHGWEETSETAKRRWCEIAQAAIAALRVPTEEMIDAAYAALDKYDISQPGACTVREAHRAMIDEALRDDRDRRPRRL